MKTFGIIALAGGVNVEKLGKAVTNIKELGYNVKVSKNILDEYRYLAGSDEKKLEELYKFFLDPEIDIILNARGGYGSIRLINKIDYEVIKNNPKIFCGFSDITALLLMIYKKTGLITYHGPMACSDFTDIQLNPAKGDPKPFTLPNFFNAINDEPLEFVGNKVYKDGYAEGIIWGGNLSTVVSLCGQDFIPDEDFIFFAEDLNEPVYKIDKMFTQLFNIEKFRGKCKGVVLGDFLNAGNEKWLDELFEEFRVPTIGGFKITHNPEKITIPIGKKASLENVVLKINNIPFS